MKRLSGQTLAEEWGLDYFKSASTLGALSESALDYLLAQGRVSELDAGEVLFDLGERGDSFFIVLKGTVELYRPYRNGFAPIRMYHFGTEIGYVSLIALHERSSRALIIEPSTLLEVDSELFARFQADYPADFGILLLNLSREMARTLSELATILARYEIEYPAR